MKYFLVLFTLFFLQAARAQEMPVPVEIQHQLLTKILTFDRNLRSRTGDTLVIGVVYQKYFRSSMNAENELRQVFSESNNSTIENIPISYVPLNLQSTAGYDTLLARHKVDLVYLTPLRGLDVSVLTSTCQRLNIITFSGVPEYANYGATVIIDTKGDNPQILINLDAAKKAGVDFKSQLLKLSKIIP